MVEIDSEGEVTGPDLKDPVYCFFIDSLKLQIGILCLEPLDAVINRLNTQTG